MQESLNSLILWCNAVGFEQAIKKCKVMSLNRTNTTLKYSYIGTDILERNDQVMNLGFICTPSMSVGANIDYISGKAILGFVRQHAVSVISGKCLLSLLLVRSVMEYGSIMWSPETAQDKLRIARVKNRFLGMIARYMNIKHEPHDYHRSCPQLEYQH